MANAIKTTNPIDDPTMIFRRVKNRPLKVFQPLSLEGLHSATLMIESAFSCDSGGHRFCEYNIVGNILTNKGPSI
jgi:hypothetical protein